jgi:ferritin-like metal-binding protein YciE
MEDKNKRLLRYLNDAYAAEVGGLMALKDLAILAEQEPALKGVVEQHILVTQSQAERLTHRILALGGDKSEQKAFVNGAIAKGSSVVNMFHDKEDKLTQDLIKAYAFEHFEVGTYISLATYAESIGDYETARLAAQIMDEERRAGNQLERFIPACAQKAIYRTAEFRPSHHEAESKRNIMGVPLNALLIPGALLAVWGVSKWLEGRDNGHRQFGPMTTPISDYDSGAYSARRTVTPSETATSGATQSTDTYSNGNTSTGGSAYVATGTTSVTGVDSGSGLSVGGTTTLGSNYGTSEGITSGDAAHVTDRTGTEPRVIVVE